MARELIDLLWRDHPLAPKGGTRGPRAKVTTSQAVDVAISVANTDGLDAVTVRRLAAELGISGMAVYTHVGSRDDLLVLMVDRRTRTQPTPAVREHDLAPTCASGRRGRTCPLYGALVAPGHLRSALRVGSGNYREVRPRTSRLRRHGTDRHRPGLRPDICRRLRPILGASAAP